VILPDVNLLVYAYNRGTPQHARARAWWENALNGDEPVALTWAAALGFVRLISHPAVLVNPLDPRTAIRHVRSWLEQPVVEIRDPGPRHLEILERLVDSVGVGANLTTDAHLAALAIEHQCELVSNDTDFARFPGLRWRNPL
jgi:toxin-antitoxin system PIN domain toxin